MEEFDFQLNKMSVSGALFDMIKLLDIGKIPSVNSLIALFNKQIISPTFLLIGINKL